MRGSLGFWYERDGYDVSGPRLMGRQSAGASFLRSLLRHTTAGQIYCVAPNREEYEDCLQRARSWNFAGDIKFAAAHDPLQISQAGVLYRPDAALADLAWLRRFEDQRGYSLCGVVHSVCTREVLQQFGQLAIAPLQPWDALICTSSAVKTAIEETLGGWTEYLASRCNASPIVPLQLPVIPLGVDAHFLAALRREAALRSYLRDAFGIRSEDIVVLYVGRLNFYAKAHPLPMYIALERAARGASRKVYLFHAGWFGQDAIEKAFQEAVRNFCPSVHSVFLDGRQPEIRRQAWAAADIFVSLSDNIQETFGLTPLEAMAVGLPVVCSDWNGYQDTVRHEIDGFRVPVTLPPAGAGLSLARDYLTGCLVTDAYLGRVCQSTAVDIDAVTRALTVLIQQPELRAKMGASGQQRAAEAFDWSVIIRRYESLWDELTAMRQSAAQIAPRSAGAPPYPLCDDPFQAFAHYAPGHLRPETIVALGGCGNPEAFGLLLGDVMATFGADCRLRHHETIGILNHLASVGPTRIADLAAIFPGREAELYRTIGWLLKFEVVRAV